MYDQPMFHWVHANALPLTGLKLQLLKLIGDLFGGQKIESGKLVWAPSMLATKRFRVLVRGKAMIGDPAQLAKDKPKPGQEENEFDVDRRNGETGRA